MRPSAAELRRVLLPVASETGKHPQTARGRGAKAKYRPGVVDCTGQRICSPNVRTNLAQFGIRGVRLRTKALWYGPWRSIPVQSMGLRSTQHGFSALHASLCAADFGNQWYTESK
jgi:hypothetical protein